ncbi:hypothetical protein L1049_020155 [Liquidambar formosana]|uniref:Uncharacterized protein n=1 Tax=Liquidambar formosana TaxID=63359 RepID=A0AAP0X9N1_LIQFO
MPKGSRGQRRPTSHQCRPTPYSLRSFSQKISEKEVNQDIKCSRCSEKGDWKDATCPICMEYPHDAVLLLCSSHDKGCRPYMCATSYHFSNCLDQYKEACPKITELLCPLCRGQVTGWTVVEQARKFLNAKKRSCMQDDCSFVGTYKDLRKHVKMVHPLAQPRKVDPLLEEEWRRMEHERERNDVISTVRSSTPGAVVVGDYVIEGNYSGAGIVSNVEVNATIGDVLNFLFIMRDSVDSGSVNLNSRLRRLQQNTHQHNERMLHGGGASVPGQEDGDAMVVGGDHGGSGHRSGRVLLGRSGRRQRRRENRVGC